MLDGWIKVDRKILESWLWQDKPFARGQAAIDLMLLANYTDKKVEYKNEIIVCKRGTVNLSLRELSERWGWSRQKVRRFINVLESDGTCTTNVTTNRTTITLENYNKYQCGRTTDVTTNGQRMDNEYNNEWTTSITTRGQRVDTTKESKKEKKERKEEGKNNNKGQKSPSVLALIQTLPIELQEPMKDFKEMRQKVKAPLTAKGLSLIIKKLQDLSGGDTETMKKIIDQSIANSWKGVYPLKTQKQKDEFDIMDL